MGTNHSPALKIGGGGGGGGGLSVFPRVSVRHNLVSEQIERILPNIPPAFFSKFIALWPMSYGP